VSAETKRATNAARQRRFQQKRRELLHNLLKHVG
jgi:peptide subunit release factor 1 (eRF1)